MRAEIAVTKERMETAMEESREAALQDAAAVRKEITEQLRVCENQAMEVRAPNHRAECRNVWLLHQGIASALAPVLKQTARLLFLCILCGFIHLFGNGAWSCMALRHC